MMEHNTFVFDFPSVKNVLTSQKVNQDKKDKDDELVRIKQEKIDKVLANAYLRQMKTAISNGIQELMKSPPGTTWVRLKLSTFDKLIENPPENTRVRITLLNKFVTKIDDDIIDNNNSFYDVHRGMGRELEIINGRYSYKCGLIKNPLFDGLFNQVRQEMLENGYYLVDGNRSSSYYAFITNENIKYQELDVRLYVSNPELDKN